ncbi:MAG: type IV toxin-antitoxin system AbiEi family antitoxin [Microbacterium sp.]|uniref:type IV toxin-antitoxin system AbiEi family antitoxin n=1 Tax=Microbacterium sp. TaxID=51671 RepID=UPI003F7FCB1C
MGSPFLYFADDRLSRAELTAACLDGHLVELGDAYIPADAVETTALRAGALTRLLGDTLAATHLSAAWIHGGLPQPPARHTVQRGVARRLHVMPDRHVVYRDVAVPASDLEVIGGVLVTTPVRTLIDLARRADADHVRAAALLGDALPAAIGPAILRLEQGTLPHKHAALDVLRTIDADQRVRRQEDVTRYTS